MITIFRNILSKDPFYTTVDVALERIQKGNSKVLIEEIRATIDREKAQSLKAKLPSVCFSGEFKKDRKDADLIKHSGFIILDFDHIPNIRERQEEIINNDFIYACWVSPSGDGLKALVKIADGSKHKEHYEALKEVFPDLDTKGGNVSRVCYESYDPNIYTYPDCETFVKVKVVERVIERVQQNNSEYEVFQKLVKWLANKNEAFVTGERNNFIFKLAAACCKFGVFETSALSMISSEFLVNSQFSQKEAERTIRSAYRANSAIFGSASFEKDILVDKVSRKEIAVPAVEFDEQGRPKDVVYGIDVKGRALQIYDEGYSKVLGISVPDVDDRWKPKRGELTLLTGIGNYGKSSFKKWYQAMRVLVYGEKFATFSPEDNPPEEYYHDFVEIILGCDCTPANSFRPSRQTYEYVYDWISQYIFYVYPKDTAPTPQYIMEVFLELIIKEKIDGCDIDPFNQMDNNYQGFAGRDKYLESIHTQFARFAIINDVYFWIIAHPTKMPKGVDGNYVCPDVFDVQDGSMWNNKMDNILVYHRPFAQTEPQNPTCLFASKKIRRQKIVGKKGENLFEMVFSKRRFFFSGHDPINSLLKQNNISFEEEIYEKPKEEVNNWLPYKDNIDADSELPF
jgi:hypothetical protein